MVRERERQRERDRENERGGGRPISESNGDWACGTAGVIIFGVCPG